MKNYINIIPLFILVVLIFIGNINTASSETVSTNSYPKGVGEVIRLVESKISNEIITNYISKSNIPYTLTAEDIINLKNKKVDNEIIISMIHRGDTVKKEQDKNKSIEDTGKESETFWWKHYGYPRVLKNSSK